MVFEGNSLCPECLHWAMNLAGRTWTCYRCGRKYPATVVADKWGLRWLGVNDATEGRVRVVPTPAR